MNQLLSLFSRAFKIVNFWPYRLALSSADKKGIKIKNSYSLETLTEVKALVLDREILVQEEELRVNKVVALNGYKENEVLTLIGGITFMSSDSSARAALSLLKERGIKITKPPLKVVEHNRKGISGHFQTRSLHFGSPAFLKEEGVKLGKDEGVWEEEERKGYKVLLLATGGKLAGFIVLAEALKPELKNSLLKLRKKGIEKILVLGSLENEATEDLLQELEIKEYLVSKGKELQAKDLLTYLAPSKRGLWLKKDGQGSLILEILNKEEILPESTEIIIEEGGFDKLPELLELAYDSSKIVKRAKQIYLFVLVLALVLLALKFLI